MIKKWIVFFGVLLLCFNIGFAWAEITEFKISASDGTENDEFGGTVSVDGDYAVVGARRDESYKGAAYVFKKEGTTWTQQAKLTAADGEANDYFGATVSIDGDYIVISAHQDDDAAINAGAVYVFKRDGETWVQQAKLTASDASYDESFGTACAISGDYIVVGLSMDDDEEMNSGSAYIFKRDGETWTEQAKIKPSYATAGNSFGRSVAIEGDYVSIGANYDTTGTYTGSVYIFKRDGVTWAEQDILKASDTVFGDNFGGNLTMDGNYLITTASEKHEVVTRSAAVYIFKRDGSTWAEQAKLTAPTPVANDFFGFGASIGGNYAAVTAVGDNTNGADSGAVYLYKLEGDTWTEHAKLTASDGAAVDLFGYVASISRNHLLAGSPRDDDNGTDSGSAYMFQLEEISNTTVTLVPDNAAPVIGDTFCVDVNIADAGALYSSAFDLTFDPAVLQYQNATEGDFLNSDGGTTFFNASLLNNDPASGILVMGASRVADIGVVSGSGTIATACFSVIGGSGGGTSVGIDNGYFEGAEQGIGVDVTEGNDPVIPVEIGIPQNLTVTDPGTRDRLDLAWNAAADASGYEVYRATASGGDFELLGTTSAASYQDSNCVLTNAGYFYKVKAISADGSSTGEFSSEAPGSAAGLVGDINKDNRVDGRDLTILARAFNTAAGDTDYDCQANLDRTGSVDGDDLVVLAAGFGNQL
ncbi:MAG: cohesin domain-containing protein [Desulfobacter sp.]